jgi:uncharacterized protein DUF4154
MKQALNFLLTLTIILGLSGGALAAEGADYMAKVITKLDSYVTWDESKSFEGDGKYLVISVVGETPLVASLQEFNRTESATGKRIKIRVVDSKALPANSHILVLSTNDSELVKTATAKLRGTGTLVISQGTGFGMMGSSLNLVEEPDGNQTKVVIELNVKAAKSEGLTVKPSLLKISRLLK